MRAPRVALLLAALLLLPPAAAEVTAQPSPKVKVAVMEGTQLFPMHVMQTKGIAEKHQFRIEQIKVEGARGLRQLIESEAFDVTFERWLTIALLRSAGQKLITVYSVSRYANEVMVPVRSPLKSLGDLKGKRVGVFGGPTAPTTWFLRLQAAKFFGFDLIKDAKVNYGGPAPLAAMLDRGELDALLSPDPQIVQMLETGKFRSIGSVDEIWRTRTGHDPLLVAVTVNESWAKQNPAIVKQFVAAYREALEYLKAHPEAWPELARLVGIKTERGARLLRERSAFVSRWDEAFIDEQVAYAAEVARTLGEAGVIPKRIPEGTFDLSYAR